MQETIPKTILFDGNIASTSKFQPWKKLKSNARSRTEEALTPGRIQGIKRE